MSRQAARRESGLRPPLLTVRPGFTGLGRNLQVVKEALSPELVRSYGPFLCYNEALPTGQRPCFDE